jgi:hypothetical protein
MCQFLLDFFKKIAFFHYIHVFKEPIVCRLTVMGGNFMFSFISFFVCNVGVGVGEIFVFLLLLVS